MAKTFRGVVLPESAQDLTSESLVLAFRESEMLGMTLDEYLAIFKEKTRKNQTPRVFTVTVSLTETVYFMALDKYNIEDDMKSRRIREIVLNRLHQYDRFVKDGESSVQLNYRLNHHDTVKRKKLPPR